MVKRQLDDIFTKSLQWNHMQNISSKLDLHFIQHMTCTCYWNRWISDPGHVTTWHQIEASRIISSECFQNEVNLDCVSRMSNPLHLYSLLVILNILPYWGRVQSWSKSEIQSGRSRQRCRWHRTCKTSFLWCQTFQISCIETMSRNFYSSLKGMMLYY